MAQSKAHIKASNKYNKEHYAKIQANIGKCDYNIACAFCYMANMSKAQLITQAIRKYIADEMESENGTMMKFLQLQSPLILTLNKSNNFVMKQETKLQ